MFNKNTKYIVIFGLISIIMVSFIFTPVVKYIYNEKSFSNYNPYNEHEIDFNKIIAIVKNITPVNNNIEGKITITSDMNKPNLTFSESESLYNVMNRIGILKITRNQKGNIYFKMKGWLLGIYGIEYSYYPLGWKNDTNIFHKNIILNINDNWLIYDPYRFD